MGEDGCRLDSQGLRSVSFGLRWQAQRDTALDVRQTLVCRFNLGRSQGQRQTEVCRT